MSRKSSYCSIQQSLIHTLSNTLVETKLTRHINMFRLTARNIVPRRIAVTQRGAVPVQMRGMADKRVENASQAAGEAKNSSPEVRLRPNV